MATSEKKRVFCPSCNTVLDVPSAFERNNTTFECPRCGFRAPYNSYGKFAEGGAPSSGGFSGGAKANPNNSNADSDATDCETLSSDETEITQNDKPSKSVGILVRQSDGKPFALQFGENRLGRERLCAEDAFISRRHSVVEVSRAGSVVKHVYYDTEAKNRTKLNGKVLECGMKAVLCAGDEIIIGKTKFIFQVGGKD